MTTLYVTEFAGIAQLQIGGEHAPPLAAQPPLAEQTVAIGVGSAASAAFQAGTTLVRVHADSICSIEFGTAPTAAATKARLAANQTEYFGVPQGQGYKVAVIQNT